LGIERSKKVKFGVNDKEFWIRRKKKNTAELTRGGRGGTEGTSSICYKRRRIGGRLLKSRETAAVEL